MNILLVGGAVRDMLIGITPHDFDYLVQGATVEQFMEAFPEAHQVGRDFPVFLVDGEEYAFARTERKNGSGHVGFMTESHSTITVQQDLMRRDLTINAIAMCPESGNIIPADERCIADIENKVLRHTSGAFREDPLRVFRVARFSAQHPNFTVAEETMLLMRDMKDELSELSAERVFSEMQKALSAIAPRRFFEVLRDCDCLAGWFGELSALCGVPVGPSYGKHAGEADCFEHSMNVLDRVSSNDSTLRFAGLCHDFGKALSEKPPIHHGHDERGVPAVESFCNRLKVPTHYRKSAMLFCREHMRMHLIQEMRSGKAVALIMAMHKTMTGGLAGFLACSIGDGMAIEEAREIERRAASVIEARLPAEYIGRGRACADIMMQIRCGAWSERPASRYAQEPC